MSRENFIDVKFHKEFVKATGIDVDYKIFKKVIVDSNKAIANVILDGNDGFKLPVNMGSIVINAYKDKNKNLLIG